MNHWIWIAIIVIIVYYISYYYRYPKEVSILQTSLADFSFDILLQKQPIVIAEQVQDWNTLKDAWFPSNKIDMYQEKSTEESWRRNRYKYILLQPYQDCEILLNPANRKMNSDNTPNENDTLLAIRLKPFQIVIVPFHWYFLVPSNIQYGWMGVHDWITRFIG